MRAEKANIELYRRRLSHEEINALPMYQYDGPVVLIRSLTEWEKVCSDVQATEVLGFDTETRPTFKKGKVNAPSLVQLATAQAVYLIQLCWLPLGSYITKILADPGILKVGVGIKYDMQILSKQSAFVPQGLVDIGTVAKWNLLSAQGLRTLSATLFGWRISKGSQCSNWSLASLSPKQIIYAATDAWVGRLIYCRMKELGFQFTRPCECSTKTSG
ncbi:MAG: 3'-5' exonuclease domain-containing protein 2 [Desulfovibrio sp.]|nr:3'-5' exonuclease domain-containing protein 2 [Desulfovibrio sp.]